MRGMPSALHEPRPERVGKHRGYGPHRAFNHLELLAHAEVERVEPELLQTLGPGLQEPPRARVEEPDVPADPPQRHHDVLGVRVRRTREEGLRGPVAELEVQRPILALHDHVRPIRRHLRERDERSRGWQAELVVRDRRFALEPSGGVGEQRRRAAARGRQPRRAARRDVVRHHDTRRSHQRRSTQPRTNPPVGCPAQILATTTILEQPRLILSAARVSHARVLAPLPAGSSAPS